MRASKTQNTEANLKKGQYFQFIVSKLMKYKPLSDGNAQTNLEKLNYFRTEKYKDSKKIKPISYVLKNKNPFDIPRNWLWLTLKDIIKLADNLNIQALLKPNELVNYVDISCIDNDKLRIKEVKLSQVDELSSRARRVLKKDLFLYSLVRPYLNNMAIVDNEKELMIGSTGFAVFDSFYLENDFLKYWLLSPFIKEYFLDMISGFNSPSISMNQFLDTPVPVAPIEEQKIIISFFNSLGSKQKKNSNILPNELIDGIIKLDNLQEYFYNLKDGIEKRKLLIPQVKQAILQEAIQGELTEEWRTHHPELVSGSHSAENLLKRIKTEKVQLIKEGKIKKEKPLPKITPEKIPFEIPKGWVWCKLGDISYTITKGSSPKWQGVQYVDEGVLFITSENVGTNEILLKRKKYVQEKFNEIEPRSILEKGDILTNIVGASIGRTTLWNLDFVANINQAVCLIRFPDNYFNKQFLINILNSDFGLKLMMDNQFDTGRGNLSLGAVSNFKIPFPSLEEQKVIVEKVEELMQKCTALEAEIKQSETNAQMLMQAVLKEAFES